MKKLIQDKNTILKDMLDGITVSNNDVEVVSDTIVVRKHKKQSGVALVSGGGSGHEPAHAGFVAEGMLDAAVCGEIFTSPTPDKILDAIKAVDNGDGVLLVIKNYAGDVMNFEMAQEMAQMEDIKVESVIVRDDIAISDPEKRRGVAGTVFVHKYAGYLAEKGVALDEIKSKVEALLPDIKSIGMALTPPMVPTTGKNGFDIEDNQMEIGIGIHGEKGLHREDVQPINVIVERLLDQLYKEIEKKPLIVMVNGMGGTPLSELNIVTKYLDEQFNQNDIDVKQWFVGDYMTALDMQGFSITVLPFSEELSEALAAPTASKYF
ncbi:dihydroxyacetone kinase subunit DhaK [Staphylococcus epidermidis]|jgi:dihydroxyacetone kinase, dhaK subunit|uniref:Dihydroxyacetone kinase family protein n=5 Tax=Staphylococcus TaxID=1279 RepID=Q5HKJ9_STAEQ|nr:MULTISPECIES: dihydroxyacetone kinase subunit DhaK [Staphylococcus]EHQ72810.1 dihydroxyacetone kinase, DhaK subunit [Staphylococcus epidermidis VCU057]EHR94084.1 dihydroxyacetone kinase, DhaK subunit [Staphylococcus epidermidis VCU123]EIJ6033595.1 dihydroxyacetone kinase subunit DhaK [Acinetobacter baumannii]EJD80038.1 dihydroxyacetone kinase, DhaK subunit [Staphylococcus epidermidis NIHLM088]EJD83971.1 dihydroxyacetone kinase, DhaK subunit [Staphylococcus epidermidis NIHLM070]MDK8341727.1